MTRLSKIHSGFVLTRTARIDNYFFETIGEFNHDPAMMIADHVKRSAENYSRINCHHSSISPVSGTKKINPKFQIRQRRKKTPQKIAVRIANQAMLER